MRHGKVLILVMALTTLSGCAAHYRAPRESEPHATLSFDKEEGSDERPWPLKLNGGRPTYGLTYRRTLRIGVGTMLLELGESLQGDLMHEDPFFTCELSFEAEAGRRYLVSMYWEDEHCLYAVTADNGTKVAGCKAQERCEIRYGVQREPIESC